MMKKNIFLSLALGISLLAFSSCASSQAFLVQGIPGTIISDGNHQQLAVLDNSGQATITIDRKEGYYSYLLAKTPNSSLEVPFALDYKDHDRGLIRGFGNSLFLGLAGISLVGSSMILTGAGAGNEEFIMTAAMGAAGAGIGAMITPIFRLGKPGASFDESLGNSYDETKADYDYQSRQSTNNDLLRYNSDLLR